jgi:hypothetical protein
MRAILQRGRRAAEHTIKRRMKTPLVQMQQTQPHSGSTDYRPFTTATCHGMLPVTSLPLNQHQIVSRAMTTIQFR